MTNFPTTLDGFQNPGASTTMDAAGFEHDAQHANLNDAVAALQAKVGINGSSDTNSLDNMVAQLVAMLLAPNSQFKIVSGAFCIWDSGAQQYRPLTCVNGVLGTGDVIS
jgi:hypothetical protein